MQWVVENGISLADSSSTNSSSMELAFAEVHFSDTDSPLVGRDASDTDGDVFIATSSMEGGPVNLGGPVFAAVTIATGLTDGLML